jgi:hypothetical protein
MPTAASQITHIPSHFSPYKTPQSSH